MKTEREMDGDFYYHMMTKFFHRQVILPYYSSIKKYMLSKVPHAFFHQINKLFMIQLKRKCLLKKQQLT
jgi:hypothetical protein